MVNLPAIERIVRTRRKSVALIVKPDGSLEVRAPLRLSRRQIEDIVRDKSGWILKQQNAALKNANLFRPRPLTDGARLWFLGSIYPLRFNDSSQSRVQFSDGFSLPEAAAPRAADLIASWYKVQARRILAERVDLFARLHQLHYRSIRITSARTRWGSCSQSNALSFTWRLVMAPPEIIDYIVVHELAHTVEKNHGRAFWQRVETMLPDFRVRRTWLKLNGRLFDLSFDASESAVRLPVVRAARKSPAGKAGTN